MKTNVHKYITAKVDIINAPDERSPEYEPWCESIFEARGQIGLICEDSAIKSGVDWTRGAEGIR